jgi:hypothetical protein
MTLQHGARADELSRMRLRRLFFLAIAVAEGTSACVVGAPEEPGCLSDAECGNDRVCRAGACFRIIGDTDAGVVDDDAG